jgi:hypothetical protein
MILLTAAGVITSGCGGKLQRHDSDRGPARGEVTFDGKPLPGGSVTIVAVDDPTRRITAPIRSGGKFQVSDAPLGDVRIAVETGSMQLGMTPLFVSIPSKYSKPEASGLTATINDSSGTEDLKIELKSR